MAGQLVFFCPNAHAPGGWGSSANNWPGKLEGPDYPEHPADMLVRHCHECIFKWPEVDDWMHFKRVNSFASKEDYEAAFQEVYNNEPCFEQSAWGPLLASLVRP